MAVAADAATIAWALNAYSTAPVRGVWSLGLVIARACATSRGAGVSHALIGYHLLGEQQLVLDGQVGGDLALGRGGRGGRGGHRGEGFALVTVVSSPLDKVEDDEY